ncbi:hypothetical protein BH09VER1_BH09VER1_09400 [soil metagenome]
MSSDPLPARIPRLGWAIAFLVAAGVIAFGYVTLQQSKPPVSPLGKIAPVPPFSFTDQYGKRVSNTDLKGKVWVADFIFTRCPGPCPMMTRHMGELNRALGDNAKDVELVSMTVDPDYDTSEVLKKYGERAGATEKRWKFLTGPKAKIDEVITKGLLLPLGQGEDGLPMHSTRFVVVDRDGWIRKLQDASDPDLVQKLLMDIRDLLREPQSGTQK